MVVKGKATLGQGFRITDNTNTGIAAWKTENGPGEVTVEAGVVCEGSNTSNHAFGADFVSASGVTFTGVAEELIRRSMKSASLYQFPSSFAATRNARNEIIGAVALGSTYSSRSRTYRVPAVSRQSTMSMWCVPV